MAEQQIDHIEQFTTHRGQPLIGIIFQEMGQEVVRYFSDDAEADAAIDEHRVQDVLALAGCWSDLSWDIVEKELDRIRHESKPTPPLSL